MTSASTPGAAAAAVPAPSPDPGDAPDPAMRESLRRLAAHKTVLICLDFDGCVAELVDDALQAAPVPANAAAIEKLVALDGVVLAYVSGRPLETLRDLASPPETMMLVGSHGAERDLSGFTGDDSPGLQLDAAQQAARSEIIRLLEQIAAEYDGAAVEHKPAGAAIHVRQVPDPELGEHILEQARTALAVVDGAHLKEGKQILEAVVVLATKGEGIEDLRRLVEPGAVFFAGDDITDEHGFAVLHGDDVGLKVGLGETRAAHRIGAPEDLAGVLQAFAAVRRENGAPQ